jgi:pimeloyl-ACP methyl ester carboxylesterase
MRLIRSIRGEVGRSDSIERLVEEQYPSFVDDKDFLRAVGWILRASVSPGAAAEFMRTVVEADVREVLPTIRVPTLVLYRKDVVADPDSLSQRVPRSERWR